MDASGQSRERKPRQRPPRKKPVGRSERSLSCLVQAVEGRKLVVELRNDLIIRGTLEESDEYMNLSMSDVSCQTVMGVKSQYEFLYVRGRNIRFLHLPRTLDPAAVVEQQRRKLVDGRIAEYKARQLLGRQSKEEGGANLAADEGVLEGDAYADKQVAEAQEDEGALEEDAYTYANKQAAEAQEDEGALEEDAYTYANKQAEEEEEEEGQGLGIVRQGEGGEEEEEEEGQQGEGQRGWGLGRGGEGGGEEQGRDWEKEEHVSDELEDDGEEEEEEEGEGQVAGQQGGGVQGQGVVVQGREALAAGQQGAGGAAAAGWAVHDASSAQGQQHPLASSTSAQGQGPVVSSMSAQGQGPVVSSMSAQGQGPVPSSMSSPGGGLLADTHDPGSTTAPEATGLQPSPDASAALHALGGGGTEGFMGGLKPWALAPPPQQQSGPAATRVTDDDGDDVFDFD